MPKIAPSSRSYLLVEGIRAFDASSPDAAADPTALPIVFAFPATDIEPTDDSWHEAEWVSAKKARLLIGPPDGLVIPDGIYDIWVNVVGAVESPKWKVDELVVSAI